MRVPRPRERRGASGVQGRRAGTDCAGRPAGRTRSRSCQRRERPRSSTTGRGRSLLAGNGGGGVGVLLQVDGQCALVSAPCHGVTIGPMDRVAAIQPDPGCGPGDKRPSGPLVCHATPDTLWAFHAKHGPRYDPGAGIPWPRSRHYQVVSGFPMAGSAPRVASSLNQSLRPGPFGP